MFTFNKYQTFPEWLKGRQSQTAGKDADIRTGDIMLSHYTKNGTRVDQKHFDNGDNTPWSNSEIAREIIMNALYDAVRKHQGEYNNIYLEHVENDWGESRAVAVRKKMVQYIWRIFDKYHTSKFDMSGHPIVTEVFHVLERTGDMPKKYK
tara:strand:+ start:111 stop:560 length:450 start_codon:yes stop_codon:yes gene_type:complete